MKIATRESYGQALKELGAENEKVVVLDADLSGATKTALFKKEFPERFISCGIAEANMTDTAAGLSTVGLIPFASTFAMFAAGRSYEMIRNSIGYPHLNVKICATHGGISVGEDGASHQMNEDFALMRAIPGMTVLCPADDPEARQMVKAAAELNGPVYIRFGRAAVPVFHDKSYRFEIGKAEKLCDGTDLTIIANGLMVYPALEAAAELKKMGVSASVLNMATIKPLDEDAVLEAAWKTGRILTAEEHSVVGGLGEAVSSLLSEKLPVQVRKVGVQDVYGHSGPAEQLLDEFGLNKETLILEALKLCRPAVLFHPETAVQNVLTA